MTKIEYKGTNGLYPWFPEHGEQLINPEYIDVVKRLSPYGKVFSCTAEKTPYITLEYGDIVFEVKPELYEIISPVLFRVGDRVNIVGSASNKFGVVVGIDWHSKNLEPIYYLAIDGKKSSRRYFESELRAV